MWVYVYGGVGLCPELMGLFSMTMTIQDLPFPVVPREEEGVRESMGEGNIEFEDNVDIGEVEDIELPRENVSAEVIFTAERSAFVSLLVIYFL